MPPRSGVRLALVQRVGVRARRGRRAGAFVDAVVDQVDAHGAAVAICTHDGSLEALRRRRAEVEQHVALALAGEHALDVAVSKERTLAVAADLGISTPMRDPVATVPDLEAVAEELGFPLVVKPSESWAESSHTRLVGVLALDPDEARAAVETITRSGGTALVQEWLTGAREAVSLLRAGGKVRPASPRSPTACTRRSAARR